MASTPDVKIQPNMHLGLLTTCRVVVLGIGLLTLVLFVVGIPGHFRYLVLTADLRALSELGITPYAAAAYRIALSFIILVVHGSIASFIFWRQRHDWMVLFMSLALITNGALFPLTLQQDGNRSLSVWIALTYLIIFLGLSTSLTLLLLFPSGHFRPRWSLFVAILWTAVVLGGVTLVYTEALLPPTRRGPMLLVASLGAVVGVYAQVYRYRHASTGVERQQIKWAVLALAAAAIGPLVYLLTFAPDIEVATRAAPNLLNQRMGGSFFSLSWLTRMVGITLLSMGLMLLPLSFAIAILRYRLWDIDIIIRRTLIYLVLSAILIFCYFAFVLLTGTLLFLLLGDSSSLTIVVSTLAIAALFTPIRRRVQELIDRRFYRHKYNAAQTLDEFAHMARDETDMDRLTDELVHVVQETMQPDKVVVWIRESEGSAVEP